MQYSSSSSSSMSGSKRKRVDPLPLPPSLRRGDASSLIRFEDVRDITVRRSRLIRWIDEPSFEHLIAGCFVRLGFGISRSGNPIYRLCYVDNVDATRNYPTYKLELEGDKTTSKYLYVFWGAQASAARWRMDRVSDSPPLLEEFEEWLRVATFTPTRRDIMDKKEAIIHMLRVEEGRKKYAAAVAVPPKRRFVNAAAEKYHLRIALQDAESRGGNVDADQIMARIRARLEELNDLQERQAIQKYPRAAKLAEINKRNQAENLNKDLLLNSQVKLSAGDAAYDPFSRLWPFRTNNFFRKEPAAVDGAVLPEEAVTAGRVGDHDDAGTASRNMVPAC